MAYSLKDAMMGGPGLDGYVYNAAIYCVDCGRKIVRDVFAERGEGAEIDDLTAEDSETMPQPIFFGESDTAQHCGACGEYVYGPQETEDDPDRAYDEERDEAAINGIEGGK